MNITSGKETPLPKLTHFLPRNAESFTFKATDTSARVNSAELLWINRIEHPGRRACDQYNTYRAGTARIDGSDFAECPAESRMGVDATIPRPSGWLPTGDAWYQYGRYVPSVPKAHRLLDTHMLKPVKQVQIGFTLHLVGKRHPAPAERELWISFPIPLSGGIIGLILPMKSKIILTVEEPNEQGANFRLTGVPLKALTEGHHEAPATDYGFCPMIDGGLEDVTVSPAADRLAWVSEDGSIWSLALPNPHADLSTKKSVWTRKNVSRQLAASQLEWSSDGKKLSFTEGGRLWVIDSDRFVGK